MSLYGKCKKERYVTHVTISITVWAGLLTLTIRCGNVFILLFSDIRIRTILLRVFAPSRTEKSRKFRRANLHLTTEYHRELAVDH